MLLGPTIEPNSGHPARQVRDTIAGWAFDEMVNGVGSIRDMAVLFVGLSSGIDGLLAGPTFELPYTVELSPRGPTRWKLYCELFATSAQSITQLQNMRPTPAESSALNGILKRDNNWQSFLE